METKRKKSSSEKDFDSSEKDFGSREELVVNDISWKIIDKYFADNPNNLVKHHLDSFNDFFLLQFQLLFLTDISSNRFLLAVERILDGCIFLIMIDKGNLAHDRFCCHKF
jgi:hypothetical protein